jgi:predicted nucleotidyltransferase
MRPSPQSFFRYPISTLLGTEATVRVLRELSLHGEELTTAALARRTGVTDPSVRSALRTLADAELLTIYGQGRAASYQLDAGHPIAKMLIHLFHAEDRRVADVYGHVGRAVLRLSPRPLALWVFGSVARGEDRAGSDLDLLLVVDEEDAVEPAADALREALSEVEVEHRVTVSVVPVSSGDILRLARTGDPFWREILSDAVVLHGPGPEHLLSRLERRERSEARDG